MRIDYGQTVSCSDVRDDHIFEECRFAGSGFADDVHMTAAVLLFDAEYFVAVAVVGYGKESNRIPIVLYG